MSPLIAFISVTMGFAFAALPPNHEISLNEALSFAQETSPDLKVAHSRELQAQSEIGIAKSHYYPKIEAQAVDSSGFAASNSALGIEGIMGSPFRTGLGAGVVLKQTIYDFGRTSNRIESVESQAEGQKQDTEITRYRVNLAIIKAYFECSLNRSQKQTWQELEGLTGVVEKEVERFVKTGQRSIVDRYLAQTQNKEAETAVADFQTREQESQKRLAILMGVPAAASGPALNFTCPILASGEKFNLTKVDIVNPLMAKANAEIKAMQAELSASKAENLPTLMAMGSAGYMDGVRLVDTYNYSLGIGISIPLFEGFRISEEVNRSSAQLQEKNFGLQATQQFLDDMNQKYDESILSANIRLEHLEPELKLADDAVRIAKKRYFEFQGDLVDVRSALTNLIRVLTDENETRAKYLISKESKEVLNGAR